MFHVAAKLFWFVAQPLGLTLCLLLLALLLLAIGWRRLAATSLVMAVLVLFVSGWTTFGAMLIAPLEDRFARPQPAPTNVAGIIVLGGFVEGRINLARGGYELNSSGDRIVETAALARLYPDARVIVTGGGGTMVADGEADGPVSQRLLEALGVDAGRLLLEDQSRDTFENATMTRDLVQPKPDETWLLVTSAFHMPRSVLLFRKAGFNVVPWPADYRSTGQDGIGLTKHNVIHTMQTTGVAIREWIGLVAYRISGRTDAVLP